MPTGIHNWGDALLTSLTDALALFLGAIPKVIGFLIVLLIGWLIAGILVKAVTSVLHAVKFNDIATRSGFAGFVRNMGVKSDASALLANVVGWFVRLIVLVVAFDELGLPAVSAVLQQLLLWLPNLVVALVVLVLAGIVANALHALVLGATKEARLGNPELLATIARIAVWGFAIVIAVNQIGVATTLVNTLLTGLVGALALALGLAFGLGGRDTAGEIVASWYQKGQEAAPKVGQAAAAAGKQATAAPKPSERQEGSVIYRTAATPREVVTPRASDGTVA